MSLHIRLVIDGKDEVEGYVSNDVGYGIRDILNEVIDSNKLKSITWRKRWRINVTVSVI